MPQVMIFMKSLITNLSPGTIIRGKWHQKNYEIIKRLGHGAIGVVYLAKNNGQPVAIKISEQSSSITTEVNVLKAFQKVQGANLGPSLLDVDDWVMGYEKKYSFYVMEYLQGYDLHTFIKAKGSEWLFILIIQLLEDLERLHQAGWVFGDLKPENLIVTTRPTRLRWIDVGGTTLQGRAIKEFTEFYDRGYWGLGSRKADPAYDLFAVAMVMIQVYYPKRFERGPEPEKTLMLKINQNKVLRKYAPCLRKAIMGEYRSSEEMREDMLRQLTIQQRPRQVTAASRSSKSAGQSANQSSSRWVESIGIIIVSSIFLIIYFFFLNI